MAMADNKGSVWISDLLRIVFCSLQRQCLLSDFYVNLLNVRVDCLELVTDNLISPCMLLLILMLPKWWMADPSCSGETMCSLEFVILERYCGTSCRIPNDRCSTINAP